MNYLGCIKARLTLCSAVICLTSLFVTLFYSELLATEPKQVVVETRLVETQDNFSKELCIDGIHNSGANGLDTATMRGIERITRQTPLDAGLSSGFGDNVGSVSMMSQNIESALRALQEKKQGDVLSQPELIAENNKPAVISEGGQTETKAGETGTNIDSGNAVIELKVTPQVSSDDRITMDVQPSPDVPENPNLPVTNDVQTAKSGVEIQGGQTIVIGGLTQDPVTSEQGSVPVLSNVPGIGKLFRSKESSTAETETIIQVTPQIIKSE